MNGVWLRRGWLGRFWLHDLKKAQTRNTAKWPWSVGKNKYQSNLVDACSQVKPGCITKTFWRKKGCGVKKYVWHDSTWRDIPGELHLSSRAASAGVCPGSLCFMIISAFLVRVMVSFSLLATWGELGFSVQPTVNPSAGKAAWALRFHTSLPETSDRNSLVSSLRWFALKNRLKE